MPIPNTRQLSGEKILKCHSNTANPAHPLISCQRTAGQREKESKRKNQRKVKIKRKLS
jgi:hypothetical protein